MPASSLLMVILMLWSIPVLIYAILFFPELKQLVRGGVRPNRADKSYNAGNELPFEYLLPDGSSGNDRADVLPSHERQVQAPR